MELLGILIAIAVVFLLRRLVIRAKGAVGETVVAAELGLLPRDKYRVLNDVTLPTPNGSSQIDHVVVSIYGIFVIETKNYKGWIYGGEHSEYWTQNIYGKKYQLYNPILQNAGHVNALRRVLKPFGPLTIFPIVAFSSKADIKVSVKDACVVYWGQILRVINQFETKRHSTEQVEAICKAICDAAIAPGLKTRREHKQDINRAREHKYDALASGRCPRCGGILVIRTGRYSRFYGCSNYPKCKYSRPC